PRAKTLTAMMDSVEHFLPEVVLIENVGGLAAGRGSGASYVKRRLDIVNRAAGTLYRPVTFMLNALNYGVPQARERLFIIATRSGHKIVPPAPSYFSPELESDTDARWRTCWDAIGDLTVESGERELLKLGGKWAELLPSIPEGSNYLWHTDRG